jgi:PAS domain S-box-containing protein
VTAEHFRNRLRTIEDRVNSLSQVEVGDHEQAIEDLRSTLEELREAEEELQRRNEDLGAIQVQLDAERRRYRELFDLAPDAYLVTDLRGTIEEANPPASQLLAVPVPALAGKALATYIAMQDRSRLRSLLDNIQTAAPSQTSSFQVQPQRGPPIHAEITYSVGYEQTGKPIGIRWLIRDLTERQRMAAEIHALNRDLEASIARRTADLTEAQRLSQELMQREEDARRAAQASEAQSRHVQKLESIGVLAGGIAHDFNNLLHVVLGNADIALSNLAVGSPARDALEEVVRATLRAADLTRQLLAYSGKGAFVVRHLHLSSEVREMATLLRTAIAKQATLSWELERDLPAINADPTQIRQIVMNLITNASDALGEAGGIITLRTGVTRLNELEGRFISPVQGEEPAEKHDGPFVFLEIGDNGSGMTPDTLGRIFDPFFSTKFAGRGLGLAAVMGIVRNHRGLIRIRTEPGEGTAFRVLFPAIPGTAARPTKPTTERSDWQGSGTILVVEDEEGVREVAERMLQEIGFQTIGAGDGREALDIMETVGDRVTAVLLDVSMPHMGGAETLRRLRAIRPELPVLMMSGYTEQSVAPRFGDSGPGPTAFLQKPFLAEDLIAVLRGFAEVSG